jgi:hypothetical protein
MVAHARTSADDEQGLNSSAGDPAQVPAWLGDMVTSSSGSSQDGGGAIRSSKDASSGGTSNIPDVSTANGKASISNGRASSSSGSSSSPAQVPGNSSLYMDPSLSVSLSQIVTRMRYAMTAEVTARTKNLAA